MKKVVLGSLVAVAIGLAVWLGSERGSRAGELLVPDSKTTARLERRSPRIELPPETVERRAVGATNPEAEPVQSWSTVELAPEPVFHGRVVDALTQQPIAGARLHLGEGPLRFAGGSRRLESPSRTVGESDAGGRIVVRGSDAASPRHALLLADGFAPAFVSFDTGHETPERAAWVGLLPAPRLEVRAVDAAGAPQPGVAVELQAAIKVVVRDNLVITNGRGFVARADTDGAGRALFENVPAEEPVELRFFRGEKQLAATERLALLAGERTSLERVVGTAIVRGRIVDEEWTRDLGTSLGARALTISSS